MAAIRRGEVIRVSTGWTIARTLWINVYRPPGPYDSFFRPPYPFFPEEEASWQSFRDYGTAAAYLDKVLAAVGRSRGDEPVEKEFDE